MDFFGLILVQRDSRFLSWDNNALVFLFPLTVSFSFSWWVTTKVHLNAEVIWNPWYLYCQSHKEISMSVSVVNCRWCRWATMGARDLLTRYDCGLGHHYRALVLLSEVASIGLDAMMISAWVLSGFEGILLSGLERFNSYKILVLLKCEYSSAAALASKRCSSGRRKRRKTCPKANSSSKLSRLRESNKISNQNIIIRWTVRIILSENFRIFQQSRF